LKEDENRRAKTKLTIAAFASVAEVSPFFGSGLAGGLTIPSSDRPRGSFFAG
jgi:hypothetical protein